MPYIILCREQLVPVDLLGSLDQREVMVHLVREVTQDWLVRVAREVREDCLDH